jgi:hypothetical protein
MRVFSPLLVIAVAASAVLFVTPSVQAEQDNGGVGTDKNAIVCAAVIPCNDKFEVREEYSNPTTFEGLFCKAKYELQCIALKKEVKRLKHEQKRKKRPGKKRLTSSRR